MDLCASSQELVAAGIPGGSYTAYTLRYNLMFVTVEKMKTLIFPLAFTVVATDAHARPSGATY